MGRRARSVEQIPELTDMQKAWFAGFLDGEGHFGIQNTAVRSNGRMYFTPIIQVTQAGDRGRALLAAVRSEFGDIGTFVTRPANPERGWRAASTWMLYGEMTRVVSRMVLPYLRLKGEQAEMIANWPLRRTYSQGRKGTLVDEETAIEQRAIFDRMRTLNAFRLIRSTAAVA